MEDLIGDLTAVPQPIEVKLFGDDPAALENAAKKVGAAIGKLQGVIEVVDGLRVAGDAISLHVDPGAAAQQGLDPGAVASQVEALIGGTKATQVRVGEQLLDVRVRGTRRSARPRERDGSVCLWSRPTAIWCDVGQVASVSIEAGQKQLTREDLAPFIDVTARLEGRDLGSAMKEVRQDSGRIWACRRRSGSIMAGSTPSSRKASADMAMVFAAALLARSAAVDVVCSRISDGRFRRSRRCCCPRRGADADLWLTGIELDISALMGLTMVIGMVTELIVFFFAEIDSVRQAITMADLARSGRETFTSDSHVCASSPFSRFRPWRWASVAAAGLQQPARHRNHLRPHRRRSAGPAVPPRNGK